MTNFDGPENIPWPGSREELIALQHRLGTTYPEPWQPRSGSYSIGGCFICYPKGHEGCGAAGDPCWAAAVLIDKGHIAAIEVFTGITAYGYESGFLALREGPLLEAALRRLPELPEVLVVNATGRDHPRRAGLALHLGARLALPTVGVTRNPLLATGPWPADIRGVSTDLKIGEETVGCWLRTRQGSPPLAVHAAWRTTPEIAVSIVMAATGRWHTPEPLRQARQAARRARAGQAWRDIGRP